MCLYRLLLIIALLLSTSFSASALGDMTIRVGTFSFSPISFIDEEGNAQGLYPDLIRELVRDEDWNVTFVPGTWAECLERLDNGQIDLLAPIAFTDERAEIYDYNRIPVVDMWGQLFVLPGNQINDFSDLDGRKIGVISKGINGRNFVKTSKALGVASQLVEYDTHEDVFHAIANREVTAGVASQHFGVQYAAEFGLVASSLKFSPLSLHFAARKGVMNDVIVQIDEHLEEWKSDKDSIYYEKLAYWMNGTVTKHSLISKWLIAAFLLVSCAVILLLYLNTNLRRDASTRSVENEARYRSLIEKFGDAVLVADSTGRFIDLNDKTANILGYTRADLLSLHVTDIDSEYSVREQLQELFASLPLDEQVLMQSTFKRKDETTFPVELHLSHLSYEGNEIFFATVRDISQRKQREALLAAKVRLIQFAHHHNSKEVLQAFLDEAETLTSSSIGFFHYFSETKQLITTQAWSTNTLEGMCKIVSLSKHCSIDDAGIWVDCIRQRRSVIHNDYISVLTRADLPEGHAPVLRELVVPVFYEGEIVAVFGVGNKNVHYTDQDVEVVQDLAESAWELIARKRAEDALASRERIYRRTHFSVERSHSAMIWLDVDGKITDCNRKLCFYTGFSHEELVGMNSSDINPSWTMDSWEEDVFPILSRDRTPARFESEMFRKNRTILPVSVELSRFSFEGEELVLAVVIDISLRKKAEKVQTQLQDELRQSHKMEAVGTLAGGIAHDFNNILTSMIGCTDMAIRRCEDERLAKYLGVVRDGERRAADLIAQILTFAKQDDELSRTPLRLDETLEEVLTLLRASIPVSVDIHTSVDVACRPVFANSSQMHQVVMNLVTNAYQALPDARGRLDIELVEKTVDARRAAKSLKMKPGSYRVLSVKDNGCGMTPEQMERIFDPYFTTRHINNGTGFGLTIVQQIVKSHNGAVLVESTPGQGSVFEVYLPIYKGGKKGALTEAANQSPVGDEQVLLVDDEVGIRFTFKEGLETFGYRVEVASDAAQALLLLEHSPLKFDAVVSDMTMPEMNGVDLAKKIQQINDSIPVVLMSGHMKNEMSEEGFPLNIREALQKPIDPEGLAVALRNSIDHNKRDCGALAVN